MPALGGEKTLVFFLIVCWFGFVELLVAFFLCRMIVTSYGVQS